MVNPCKDCLHAPMLEQVSGDYESWVGRLANTVENVWDIASRGTIIYQAALAPDSGASDTVRSDIEQKHESALDTTARYTRIAGELSRLFESALAEADVVHCASTQKSAGTCPKLLQLVGINNEAQQLISEMINPEDIPE